MPSRRGTGNGDCPRVGRLMNIPEGAKDVKFEAEERRKGERQKGRRGAEKKRIDETREEMK